MEEYFSPEFVVACLGAVVVLSIALVTACALYNDEGVNSCLHSVKGSIQRTHRKKKERKKHRSAAVIKDPTRDTCTPWEEVFTLTDPVTPLDSSSVRARGTVAPRDGVCLKCNTYSAKKNCKFNACGKCCRGNPGSVCRAHGTGYEAASAELNSALQYGYVDVDISYSNLKICPPQLVDLGFHVVTLNLSNNRLSSIPDEIGLLKGLRELFLQYNYISCLPDSICSLTSLIELDIKNNALSSLPLEIGRLRQLDVFCAMNNLLACLPSSIGGLVNLEELSLHSNALQSLPEELCKLRSLKVSLYCGENKLKKLPSNIGQLQLVEEMDLSYNQLVTLPNSICRCKQLTRLWLTSNKLEALPPQIGLLSNLKELHVRRNSLHYFPASITDLPLYTFSAQNNPILKERQIEKLSHTPSCNFPPLLELAARVVSAERIPFGKGDIPLNLEVMLSRGVSCSRCGRQVFVYYSRSIVFKLVGVYYRLPLHEILCSPHKYNNCDLV